MWCQEANQGWMNGMVKCCNSCTIYFVPGYSLKAVLKSTKAVSGHQCLISIACFSLNYLFTYIWI